MDEFENNIPAVSPFADESVEPELNADELETGEEEEGLAQSMFEDESEEPEDDDDSHEDDSEDDDESDDEDEDLSDEEIDELLESLDADDEEEEQVQTVPHAALHKERARRKELQAYATQLEQTAQGEQERVKQYETALEAVEKQIKDLGLEDVVKLDKPKAVDPELAAYKAQQAEEAKQQKVMKSIGEIREEAAAFLPEYPMIKGDSPEHEEIVLGLALAATHFGSNPEDAAARAMKILNDALTAESKKAIRQRKPVQRKTTVSRSAKRQPKRNVKVEAGNTKSFFDDLAKNKFS